MTIACVHPQAALPRLVHAYERGRLVPFVGAGLSTPDCPLWPKFVGQLEALAGQPTDSKAEESQTSDELVRRAYHAVEAIKRRSDPGLLSKVVTAALENIGESGQVSPGAKALGSIAWPLILTTNYDAHLFWGVWPPARVVGRSPSDCADVLASLEAPWYETLVWALQGYVGTHDRRFRDESTRPANPSLREQLVVGHSEYRRVTHVEPHFRRAFAEVFRNRSFLFLGTGLKDGYLLELFGEILETFGPNPEPHYALIQHGQVDPGFIRDRFNILSIEYQDHKEVPEWIGQLRAAIYNERPRALSWGFRWSSGGEVKADHSEGDVQIVRAGLPVPKATECVAISVGIARDGHLRPGFQGTLLETAILPTLYPEGLPGGGGSLLEVMAPPDALVMRYPRADANSRVFLVCARDRQPGHGHDARLIGNAMRQLLDGAESAGFQRLYCPVIAGGPGRLFPEFVALTEMVRACRAWRLAGPDRRLKVVFPIVSPVLLLNVATGRVDVKELLACDDIRFWVEVTEGGPRSAVVVSPRTSLGVVAREFKIPLDGSWTYMVVPTPYAHHHETPLDEGIRDRGLDEVGIVRGSTLRFARSPNVG